MQSIITEYFEAGPIEKLEASTVAQTHSWAFFWIIKKGSGKMDNRPQGFECKWTLGRRVERCDAIPRFRGGSWGFVGS